MLTPGALPPDLKFGPKNTEESQCLARRLSDDQHRFTCPKGGWYEFRSAFSAVHRHKGERLKVMFSTVEDASFDL